RNDMNLSVDNAGICSAYARIDLVVPDLAGASRRLGELFPRHAESSFVQRPRTTDHLAPHSKTMLRTRLQIVLVAVVAALACVREVAAANNYPIVLVHGFAGWGREEKNGLKYFGGYHGDYQARLQQDGFDVRTAVVSPFGSNWDRAVELYAYVKGGCVNYGPNHAKHHGHNVTGRCYEGLYPEWGNVVNGKVNKVHFMGHSMGGQTVRMLAQLLAHGSKGAPIEEDTSSHTLFAGGKSDWIHSVTAIATPNQGTLLANGAAELGDVIEQFATAMISASGVVGESSIKFFDAKMDAWSISPRQSDESIPQYIKRIVTSKVFKNGFYDLCMYSLSTFGAASDLAWVDTQPNIFYYSISTQDTFRLGNIVLPRLQSMVRGIQAMSTFLGSTYALKNGFSRDWQPNDGIVNTISTIYDGKSELVEDATESKTGRWHHIVKLTTVDHEAVHGMKKSRDVYDAYLAQAKFLYDLPTAEGGRRLSDGSIVHTTSADIVESLNNIVEQMNTANQQDDIALTCSQTRDVSIQQICAEYYQPKHSSLIAMLRVSLEVLLFTILSAALSVRVSVAINDYPIVLVHGFAGWGRTEMGGMKYWGGFNGDYEQRLKDEGYDVRTAAVGPFSSQWDRAVELYSYIKGGCVNYGPNHSKTFGHAGTGRCFEGIYPEWGNVVNGKVNKIHLVGHSMGGQTIRMLAQLLAHGTKGAPVQEAASTHPVFAGDKEDWIHSITTISTPNQGTLLANGLAEIGELTKIAATVIIAAAGVVGDSATTIFDAKLDHWGIAPKQPGEKLSQYIKRIFASGMFKPGFHDISMYSLSTFGAAEDLTWVETQPNIFYYSFSTQDTFRMLNVHLPRPLSMLAPLQPLSTFLGSTYALKRGFSSEWQANDGVVNTISMRYDGKAPVVEGVQESKTGRWHHLPTLTTLDHEAVVGMKPFNDVYGIYQTHAKLLKDLPAGAEGTRRLEDGSIVHKTSDAIIDSLNAAVEEINSKANTEEDIALTCSQATEEATLILCAEYKKTHA
ncbi:TPA: hypothetical protein N0F65_006168, partial [Lagenidium giganteum]